MIRNHLTRLTKSTTHYYYSTSTLHCLQTLSKYDPESVLQLPFWPTESQTAFVAIQSFQSELRLIPSSISSGKTLIAKIRYQWWRDVIETCYNHQSQLLEINQKKKSHQVNQIPSNHPLIEILKTSIQKHGLSKYYFTRMINGLESHYLEPRFASTNDLVKYSQSTTYSNLSLLLQVLNTTTSNNNKKESKSEKKLSLQTIDHSLSHMSNFLTIIKLLKQLPNYLLTRQINFIPTDLMECRDEDLFRLFSNSNSNYNHFKLKKTSSSSLSDGDGDGSSLGSNPIHLVQNTLFNLLALASSELIATREVLSLNHTHSHQDLNRQVPSSQTHQELLEKITLSDPYLMPLFLTATPAKNQQKKLEKLINNLEIYLLKSSNKNKNRNGIILNQFNLISKKPDWKLPFHLFFDSFFNKI